jgi:hypothetical protein
LYEDTPFDFLNYDWHVLGLICFPFDIYFQWCVMQFFLADEMPESELSAASIQALADKVELDVQGGLASRPLLSVPHVISDEASCYYHGYVLVSLLRACE